VRLSTVVLTFSISVTLLFSVATLSAQEKNPCNDEKYVRLKAIPRASLTESERRYMATTEEACEKFKAAQVRPADSSSAPTVMPAKVEPQKIEPPKAEPPKVETATPKPVESPKEKPLVTAAPPDEKALKDETILNTRNVILGTAAAVGLTTVIILFNNTTTSPF
jgi:outer membrane biosynthesis protein TonB